MKYYSFTCVCIHSIKYTNDYKKEKGGYCLTDKYCHPLNLACKNHFSIIRIELGPIPFVLL